jgi:hypothetical protein
MKAINRKTVSLMIGVVLVVSLLGYFIVTAAIDKRLEVLQLETKVLIEEQKTLLTSIAEITARNGADELTERIIKDCSVTERVRFDNLLSSLDKGLARTELVELERLFGRCGGFFAERKAIMVSRMSREYEVLEILVHQLSNLTGADATSEYQLANWKELSDLELKQSDLFSSLVSLQDNIITVLLEGNTASSQDITKILQEVSTVQQTLSVVNMQASTVRSGLVPL